MRKIRKITVNTYDVKIFTFEGKKNKYYNCPNIRCINSIGYNIKEKQDTCQECKSKLDWKYLK